MRERAFKKEEGEMVSDGVVGLEPTEQMRKESIAHAPFFERHVEYGDYVEVRTATLMIAEDYVDDLQMQEPENSYLDRCVSALRFVKEQIKNPPNGVISDTVATQVDALLRGVSLSAIEHTAEWRALLACVYALDSLDNPAAARHHAESLLKKEVSRKSEQREI